MVMKGGHFGGGGALEDVRKRKEDISEVVGAWKNA